MTHFCIKTVQVTRQLLAMSFSDKVVIVTGASSGIGAAIAVQFAEQGANVVIVARSEAKLKEVAEKCKKHSSKILTIVGDVSKDSDVQKVIKKTISQFNKIDILINNAGIYLSTPIYEANAMEVYDSIMTTNLRSVVYLTNLAAPYLIKSKGNIINISSVAALEAISPGNFAYCTSKAGMDHFTKSAALDLGPKGVRVNTVNPGPVRTAILNNPGDKAVNHDVWDKFAEYTILGRVCDSEEVGDLVLFLASEKAKSITGSSYLIDNGILLSRN